MNIEYVDILDESGNPTSRTKTKEDAHRDQDWHPGAHVWIVNSKGDILFQKRGEDKVLSPGKWDISAAGHVSAGEKSLETARRETEEEIGILYPKDKFEFLFRLRQITPFTVNSPHNSWDDVYLIESEIDISKLKIKGKEVSRVKLIPFKDFKAIMTGDMFVPRQEEYERLIQELSQRYPS